MARKESIVVPVPVAGPPTPPPVPNRARPFAGGSAPHASRWGGGPPGPPWLEGLLAIHILFLAHREDLLDLDARRRVFDQVTQYPGIHLREIARALEMETNHAKYHLQYLERHGLLSSRREGGFLVFFPKEEGELGLREAVSAKDKEVLALLRRPVPLHVTLLLLDRGESTLTALAEEVDVSASTLHYHLKKMEKVGAIVSRREGRERHHRLADHDHVLQLLLRYKPPDALVEGFLDAWEQLELGGE